MFVDPKRKFYSRFTPKFIPWNVIIDARGIIRYSAPGFAAKKLQKVLKELRSQNLTND